MLLKAQCISRADNPYCPAAIPEAHLFLAASSWEKVERDWLRVRGRGAFFNKIAEMYMGCSLLWTGYPRSSNCPNYRLVCAEFIFFRCFLGAPELGTRRNHEGTLVRGILAGKC